MLRKVLQGGREEGKEGDKAKNREGVLLMISPPAVGLGGSERREGGEGREEQWQWKQTEL